MRSLTTFALLAAALCAGSPAGAAEPGDRNVAAPGACAEPRRFDGSGACPDCPTASAIDEKGFSVAGPARAHFSPNDVAATVPAADGAAPPELGEFEGRGPCDTPGSCGGAVTAVPGRGSPGGNGGVTVIERPPRPGGPPGTGRD